MTIEKDRVVSLMYTLTDSEGAVLDSSTDTGPLSYLHGGGNIIVGLEKALEGKTEGDSFKVTVPAAEAYGVRDEGLVVNVPRARFQGVAEIEPGMQFEAETAEGSRLVTVTKVSADMVTVDANHTLAGMDLNFDVSVVAVRGATEEELEHGHPHSEHQGCGCGGDCGDDCGCGDEEEGGCGCGGCH
jgi:FKBP-type peptidyl-prolyl cis-trans isomerase SlyD